MADNKLLVPFHFNPLGEARVSQPPADRVIEWSPRATATGR